MKVLKEGNNMLQWYFRKIILAAKCILHDSEKTLKKVNNLNKNSSSLFSTLYAQALL